MSFGPYETGSGQTETLIGKGIAIAFGAAALVGTVYLAGKKLKDTIQARSDMRIINGIMDATAHERSDMQIINEIMGATILANVYMPDSAAAHMPAVYRQAVPIIEEHPEI